MKRRIWPVLVSSALGLAVLLALGVWQVQRLAWKEALIAAADASLASPAITLAEARTRPDPAYAKVKLEGTFKVDTHLLVISTWNGGPAWVVVRPVTLPDGDIVLVECGKSLTQTPPPPPVGPMASEAVVQLHPTQKGYFDAENPPGAGVFYWWDVQTMAARLGATEKAFTLALLPGSPGTEGLQVEPPKANLRNNHLGYAITWFGLAAVLVVMTSLFLLRLRREAANGSA